MRNPLAKPHRVAVLAPDVTTEGVDTMFAREAAALVWVACIELLQRHPAVAVLDADATPLEPQDGHYAPRDADRGALPSDDAFGPTRRDELLWLELPLIPRGGTVRLHCLRSDGATQVFDRPSSGARAVAVGDQIQQAFASWATARELGPFARRVDAVGADELIAGLRVIAPLLAEQARLGRVAPPPQRATPHADDVDASPADSTTDSPAVTALRLEAAELLAELDGDDEARRKQVRLAAARLPAALPATWKVAALRVLELALGDDLGDAILALDAEHPQALLRACERHGDAVVLRRVLASAPCWGAPYVALRGAASDASPLERVAGATFASVCRPASLDVIDAAAHALADTGRVDDGVRLLERLVGEREDRSEAGACRAHVALLELHARTGRDGAWLAQAMRSARRHGCGDAGAPRDADAIAVDLRAADALAAVGRLDDAIALAANRLADRDHVSARDARALADWRSDPRWRALAAARDAAYRGDDAGAIAAYTRGEPATATDLALFVDALVAIGREDEVPLAHAHLGGDLATGSAAAVARLAAARALMAAGEWRRGLEEMWRVSLAEPCRDEHAAVSRCGIFLACAPVQVIDAAIAERLAIGAPTLARRMARDVADFTPAAAKSGVVARALGKSTAIEFDAAWLAGFAASARGRAIASLFDELGAPGADRGDLQRADQLVNRWLEVAYVDVRDDADLAAAAAYVAAHALARYLALTTQPPTVHAGALRTVAGEALALVRRHAAVLADRDARALLAAIDAPLRRADRWVGIAWLGRVERSLALDERGRGDLAAFARDHATVASRLLGPEEVAVLAWSVARLHRERPDGWAAACTAQAMRLAMHTGRSGIDEWADAVAAQRAAGAIDLEDAIDQLHVACYLAEGVSPAPSVHAARVLFDAGRAGAAVTVLAGGLGAATPGWRDTHLAPIAEAWRGAKLDVPYDFDRVAAGVFEALSAADYPRAEKLGRWAVAFDPRNSEAHRNLGLALAHQGKAADAMRALVRGTRDLAPQILAGVLYQAGKLAEAMAVLDYASRWYVRADQWLAYAGIAYAAMDSARTAAAYRRAYELEPAAFDATQLDAFAGVLDEVGDGAACARIAAELLRVGGDDASWKTSAWNHQACAAIRDGRFDDAIALAERAVAANPTSGNAPAFQATLERARAKDRAAAPALVVPTGRARDAAFERLDAGDFATAAARLDDDSWRARRAALAASRYRTAAENLVDVTPRARAAALGMLAATVGVVDRDAVIARALALGVRDQAWLSRDPVPALAGAGSRVAMPTAPPELARVVVPDSRVATIGDYVSLLRSLAQLAPRDALVELGLDDAGFAEVARAWAAAMAAEPQLAAAIAAALAAPR
nr:hypothetical protein [Kofleriaceae bacterium]